MHLKDVPVSHGRVDVFGILQETVPRKVMRRIAMWMGSPSWLPTESYLTGCRTSTRGQVRNLRAGHLMQANTISGEISPRCARHSTVYSLP